MTVCGSEAYANYVLVVAHELRNATLVRVRLLPTYIVSFRPNLFTLPLFGLPTDRTLVTMQVGGR